MNSWNLVLQLQTSAGLKKCKRYAVSGIARACRILIYSCDATADAAAKTAHKKIETHLLAEPHTTVMDCNGPGMWGCMAWVEASCLQVLVPVIGACLSTQPEADLLQWLSQAGNMSIIMPSLLPGIAHATAFARASQVLSRFTATDWYGYPDRLAERVLQTALHRAKPSIFISYKRSEAGALADQLFDALARDGFRVFVDRYSGTPGRYFPQELAEEMADKAVLLVIETPGLMQSKWTLWEIAFARRYRLGLIALQMDSATALTPIRTRIRVPGSGSLASSKLDQVMEFIRKEHVAASLRRTAFYRGLVRSAAAAGGGSLTEPPNGLFELRNGSGNLKAIISAVGKPGRLGDVHALMRHPAPGPPGPARLALGQHRHLPPAALDDLKWLADKTGIELHGHYEGYKRVNALC